MFLFCKKTRTAVTWNADYTMPIAYGSLGIADILSDSIINIDSNQIVNLNIKRNLFTLNFDSIISIPVTEVSDTFELPFPVVLTINPGQLFISETNQYDIDLQDVELREFYLLSADFDYLIESSVQGEIIYEYIITSATNDLAQPFTHQVVVPPALPSQNSSVTGSFKIENHLWNLTGLNGNLVNKIIVDVNVKVSDNNSVPVNMSNLDTLYFNSTISNVMLESAKGYFGSQNFHFGPDTTDLSFFDKILSGSVDIEDIIMDLDIINGLGIDARTNLNELFVQDDVGANKINFSHSIINQALNINRAYKNGNQILPQVSTINFSQNNSNIEQVIESLPGKMGYSLDMIVNPLANVSAHNDFIHKDYPFALDMNLAMPLNAIVTNLTYQDTIELNIPDTLGLNYARLYVEIQNGLPYDAELSISIINGSSDIISPDLISSGLFDVSGLLFQKTQSELIIDISKEDLNLLKLDNSIILTIKFNTANQGAYIDVYDYYNIDFKINADFNLDVNIN